MPKRRKNSCTGSSALSSALPRRCTRLAFSTTEMFTTAGPTCSTRVAKSGSVRPFSVPTGCAGVACEESVAGAATCGAGGASAAAATEDLGEQAPIAKAMMATPARRLATNSDISTNPLCENDAAESDRAGLAKFSTTVPMRTTSGDFTTSPQICAQQPENKGQGNHGPVAGARIGRQARTGLQLRTHYVCFIFRRPGEDLPARANDGGDAVVGGPHHGPARLAGAQARDLQMLVARGGAAEPGVVGDVHEQGRGAQCGDLGGSVAILVTDTERNLLARGIERRLHRVAAIEIRIRQAHEAEPVADET